VHLVLAFLSATIHLSLLNVTVGVIARYGPLAERESYGGLRFFDLGRLNIELLLYALIWLACSAVNTQLAAQRDAMRSLEVERQLSTAHLRALQMQLEPHFLFNTLNAVTTLMEFGRKSEALATVERLNAILRTVLKRDTPSKIPLAQELEIVESYLAIERVR